MMSPWDSIRYFDTPKETAFIPAFAPGTRVAAQEMRRVVLMFGCATSTADIYITTKPTTAPKVGFILRSSQPLVILAHRDVGPLCQQEWWAIGDGITAMTVWEVLLNDWPETLKYEDLADE